MTEGDLRFSPSRRKFDHAAAAAAYLKGSSCRELALHHGVQEKHMRGALKAQGCEMRRGGYLVWQGELLAQARAMASQGLSAREIAIRLGVTKQAVCGASERHGFRLLQPQHASRPKSDHGGGLAQRIKSQKRAAQFGNPGSIEMAPSSTELIGCLVGQDIPGRLECKWIEAGQYCGQPCHSLTSWCATHHGRVYNFSAPRPRFAKSGEVRV